MGASAWSRALLGRLGYDGEGRRTGDIAALIHGYNVDAGAALGFHRRLEAGLRRTGYGGQVVSFDWPARGTFLNYLEDGLDAAQSAITLARDGLALLARLSAPDCRVRVHVIAHSMGAFVAREAFRLAEFHPAAQAGWGVSQLVLVAADISQASLASDLGAAMLGRAQRVTNYFSGRDLALASSNLKRLGGSPRLGRHGAPAGLISRIADVDCGARALARGASGLVESHSWYFEDAAFYADLAATLAGDLDRALLPTRDAGQGGRLRLKPD
jgi:esterase/lipase superfamily enzyme